jgi:hypothetical protein
MLKEKREYSEIVRQLPIDYTEAYGSLKREALCNIFTYEYYRVTINELG